MATRDIRTRFVLDGEAKYAKAMKSISTEMRLLDAELGATTVSMDKNSDAMDILSATSATLSKKMDVQKQKIDAVAKELADAEKAYGENSEQAKKYAIELANAEIKLGKMKNELEANDRQMEELKQSTNAAGNEMKELGNKADSASTSIKSSDVNFSGFGKTLASGVKVGAQAAALAIAAVATAAVAATKAVIDLAIESGRWADEMLTTSEQTNISTQTLQEWGYAARFVDTEVETMTKGLAKVVKATGEAASAGSGYIQIADGMSVAIYDASGNLKSSEQIFYDSIDAIKTLGSETEKEIASQELFGKSYQDMMPLIKAGSQGLKDYAKEAKDAGVILDDGMIKKLGEFDDTMQKVDAQVDTIKRSFVSNFIPAIESGADSLMGVMDVVAGALSDGFQPEDVKTIGGAVSDAILEMLKGVSDILPEVATVLTELITAAVGIMSEVLPTLLPILIDASFTLLQALMDSITENTDTISDAVVSILMTFANFIITNLPVLIDTALQIIIALANGLAAALPTLIPSIVTMVLQIVTTIMDNLPMLLDAALNIIVALVQGLMGALPLLIEYLPTLLETIVSFIIENLPVIIEAAVEIIFAIMDGLVQALPDLIMLLPELIKAIIDAFANTDWLSVGTNIVEGIGGGIIDGVTGLVDSAIKACAELADSVKDFFGIASPSKMFTGFGQFLSEGMAIGIENKAGMVTDAINSLTPPEISPKVSAELMSNTERGGTIKKIVEHTGTLRVEGVNTKGELIGTVEILMDQLKLESMYAGA